MEQPYYAQFWDRERWRFQFQYGIQIKKKTILYILRHLGVSPSNKRVLDVGFGSCDVLLSFDDSCELYGIESSRSAIDRAVHVLQGRTFCVKQATPGGSIDFPDRYFDLIVCSHVLEHVPDDQRLLREIYRTLTDCGIAIILVPIHERHIDVSHLRNYTFDGLSDAVIMSGFEIVNSFWNDCLWNLFEPVFANNIHKRVPLIGPLISGIVNIPFSSLPFVLIRYIDMGMQKIGMYPRQLSLALRKAHKNG